MSTRPESRHAGKLHRHQRAGFENPLKKHSFAQDFESAAGCERRQTAIPLVRQSTTQRLPRLAVARSHEIQNLGSRRASRQCMRSYPATTSVVKTPTDFIFTLRKTIRKVRDRTHSALYESLPGLLGFHLFHFITNRQNDHLGFRQVPVRRQVNSKRGA